MTIIKLQKKRAICNIHDDIDNLIDDLYRLKLTDYVSRDKLESREENDFEYDMDRLLSQMKDLIKEAIDRGQAMEDRLISYKTTIESLGFKRDKNNKIRDMEDEIDDLKAKIVELNNLLNNKNE